MVDLSKLAIIVLNYNSSDLSIKATENILNLKTNARVILVDNCSTDDSQKKLRARFENENFVDLVFSETNSGYASGNNLGIKYVEKTNSDINTILIMNPDIVVPQPEILFSMYSALEKNNDIGVLTVKTIFNGKLREPNECAWRFLNKKYMFFGGTILGKNVKSTYYNELISNEDGLTNVDVVQGCFFMSRLSSLKKVGYLDENTFLYSEESILAKRMYKIGKHGAVLPNYCIYHNHKEKDRRLIKYKNKTFDMNCYYHSRKYYIKNYSDESKLFILTSTAFLNLDLITKKVISWFISMLKNKE